MTGPRTTTPEPRGGSPWLSSDEQATWRAYLAATQAVERLLEAQLQRDADMPHAYYHLLVRLSEAPGHSLRMSVLASSTDSSRSRLSHAVGALEQRGWVRREPAPDDRRGQVAVLTGAGLRVLQHAAPGHVAAVRVALFDPLSKAQQEQLRDMLAAVKAHADGVVPGSDG